ncbi:LPS assembly lipoprotein LptE [Arenicella sp.]|nr:LPS assembly lipoprotein LptE [Arenicella sp.]
MKIVSRALTVLMVASALTACGFNLRGSTPLPDDIKNIYVDADNGPFKEKMEEILQFGGATIAANSEAASTTLVVLESIVRKTVGTLDERGKANSYELNYVARYNLVNPEGVILRTASLNENRRFDFDPDIVLETDEEEEELILDMEESIALRIVRQLSTVTSTSIPAPTQ